MAKRIVVDPMTRIEGHLRVDVEVDNGKVTKAWSSGQMWRGIELILEGRDPRDAWIFTQRICGVCTTVHAIVSVRAVENALKLEVHEIDHIKIVNSGLNSFAEFGKETLPQFDVEELKKLMSAAKEHNLETMVHANGRRPFQTAVAAGCDSIEHGFFMGNDNLKTMADEAIFWVPTAETMDGVNGSIVKLAQSLFQTA